MAYLLGTAPAAAAEAEVKIRQVEGLRLEYRIRMERNPRVTYDGRAYVERRGGNPVYFVVLNRAYLEKEGRELFRRLSEEKQKDVGSAEVSPPWKPLETESLSWKDLPVAELRALQLRLEALAWRDLHERSLAAEPDPGRSRDVFVAAFTRARLAAIEEHEVSHLIDLARGRDQGNPDFERNSELRAFYAELARGGNPLDSMSQALAGLLDEARRGRTMDYSREKVSAVVRLLRGSADQGLFPFQARRLAGVKSDEFPPLSSERLAWAGRTLLQSRDRL